MAFQPAPDIAKVAIEAEVSGEECVTTFHFFSSVEMTQDSLKGLAEAVYNKWLALAVPHLCSTYRLFQVVATDMSVQDGFKGEFVPDGEIRGAILAPANPNNVSLAVGYSSGRVGRSTRGRFFWPVIPKDQVVNSEIAGGYVQVALTAGSGMIGNGIVFPGYQLAVCSREINKVKRPVAVPYIITTCKIEDNVVDSQRRRLPKRGQ